MSLETARIALTALARTKTRSLLTVLGVVIGVAAVIAMVSIGEGARARVAATFESMGTNTLLIRSGSTFHRGARGGAGSLPTLTWDDMAAIGEVPQVALVAPELSARAQLSSELDNWMSAVTGTTPEWFEIRSWPAARGRLFRAAEVAAGAKVAVIGKTVAENLFAGGDPLGQTIRVDRVPFVVIGIAAEKGAAPWGADSDDRVIIPSTTFTQKISGGLHKYIPGSVIAAAVSRDATAGAKLAIEELLRARHRIREGADDDFWVRDPSEIADAQAESAATITSLLAGVALVSLLVGGIGIMNIMLVSVTERTREIGLRMAVGARPGHVLSQFLVESAVLSVAGGVLGVAAGVGAASFMASRFGFPLLVRADAVALAVGVSAAVGIGFGFYPAFKASRLDPIEALHYE